MAKRKEYTFTVLDKHGNRCKGLSVSGDGPTEAKAREDAAQYLDNGEQTGEVMHVYQIMREEKL